MADSTLGLTPEEALQEGIHLVPQQVIHEDRAYRDLVEIRPEKVLELLEKGERLTTSQVVPVRVSGKLSGTLSTAMRVAQGFGGRVLVLDSWSLNGELKLVLEEARRLLEAGVAWEGLEAALAPFRARVRGYVLPQTLTYLHRSGRISGLKRFVGGLLRILPILEVKEGGVFPGPRVRGFGERLRKVVELFRRDFPGGARVYLAHAGNEEGAKALGEAIRQEGVEVLGMLPAGAAVSVHAGPGTVALFAGPRG